MRFDELAPLLLVGEVEDVPAPRRGDIDRASSPEVEELVRQSMALLTSSRRSMATVASIVRRSTPRPFSRSVLDDHGNRPVPVHVHLRLVAFLESDLAHVVGGVLWAAAAVPENNLYPGRRRAWASTNSAS
jgi:hypothetical protein